MENRYFIVNIFKNIYLKQIEKNLLTLVDNLSEYNINTINKFIVNNIILLTIVNNLC